MKIDELILQASKSKNRVELNAYKNLKAELQKVLTAKNAPKYSDELFIQVASKYAKSLEDAIGQFKGGGRKDLAKEYETELDVVKKLIPQEGTISEIMLALFDYAGKRDQMVWVDENNHNLSKVPRHSQERNGTGDEVPQDTVPTTDGKKLMDILNKYIVS